MLSNAVSGSLTRGPGCWLRKCTGCQTEIVAGEGEVSPIGLFVQNLLISAHVVVDGCGATEGG